MSFFSPPTPPAKFHLLLVNRIWPARPHTPSRRRRPVTTSLEEEEEEMKAAQRKWKFYWLIRKPPPTSHLSYVLSSEPLGPTFWLAQHLRSCRTSSPLLIHSCSGKNNKSIKWWHVTVLCSHCWAPFANFDAEAKASKNSSIVPKCYFQGIFFACLMNYKFYLHDLYESIKASCSLCKSALVQDAKSLCKYGVCILVTGRNLLTADGPWGPFFSNNDTLSEMPGHLFFPVFSEGNRVTLIEVNVKARAALLLLCTFKGERQHLVHFLILDWFSPFLIISLNWYLRVSFSSFFL